ncbi:hypothetical protein CSPX01_16952 [Colletotrichum filicis]|nr:hypothetical protein CSPX01_16952 [Colletotrichum filicis]
MEKPPAANDMSHVEPERPRAVSKWRCSRNHSSPVARASEPWPVACPCVLLFLLQTNPSPRLSAPLPSLHRRRFCLPGPLPKLLHKKQSPKSCKGKGALAPSVHVTS